MTPASIHTSSNPGTAHPPLSKETRVLTMEEWDKQMHRKRGLVERVREFWR